MLSIVERFAVLAKLSVFSDLPPCFYCGVHDDFRSLRSRKYFFPFHPKNFLTKHSCGYQRLFFAIFCDLILPGCGEITILVAVDTFHRVITHEFDLFGVLEHTFLNLNVTKLE